MLKIYCPFCDRALGIPDLDGWGAPVSFGTAQELARERLEKHYNSDKKPCAQYAPVSSGGTIELDENGDEVQPEISLLIPIFLSGSERVLAFEGEV